MLIAVSVSYGNNGLQTLLLEAGFTLIFIIAFIKFPRYRLFIVLPILAMGLFIYANYSPTESLRWTLISLGIALVALGIALHTFSAGESLERKIEKIEGIDKKLDEILTRMTRAPKESSS